MFEFVEIGLNSISPLWANIFLIGFFLMLFVSIFYAWIHQKYWLSALSVLLLAILAEQYIESRLIDLHRDTLKQNAARELSEIRAKLEGTLNNNLSIVKGMVAYIASNPELTQEEYNNYSSVVFRRTPLVINIAAAPDLIIKYVYPIKGNEAAIGLNYNTNPVQREAVYHVRDTGEMIVAGPINLVQGGFAFISRAPVYVEKNDKQYFWGIVSSPINAHGLYRAAGLKDNDLAIHIAIRGYDSKGAAGKVFFGNDALFTDKDSVSYNMQVGTGSWLIVAKAKAIPGAHLNSILILRYLMILLVIPILMFQYFRVKQNKESRALQVALKKNEEMLNRVGDIAKVGPWRICVDTQFFSCPAHTAGLVGFSPRPIRSKMDELYKNINIEDLKKLNLSLEESKLTNNSFDIEIQVSHKKSNEWLRVIGTPIIQNETVCEFIGAIQNITERKNTELFIRRQAKYDTLTNLPNRILFTERLKKELLLAKRNNRHIAVIFLDLDDFKMVNDNLGHKAGDKLLIQAAERINNCLRKTDTVARLGGDEFSIIIPDLKDISNSYEVAEHILKELNKPFLINTNEVFCSASLGISIFPDDAVDVDTLLKNADQAMYSVKHDGRNGWQYFTQEMQARSERRHVLYNELVTTLSHSELDFHLQPIFCLDSMRITKCEALARWQRKNGEFVSPLEFISLAEETGLINRVDRFVLENSAKCLHSIKQNGAPINLSVNVSPRVFHTKDNALNNWLSLVEEVVKKVDLTVEITERLITDDSAHALKILTRLKDVGIKISIDDFGTGYSSLSYLTKFPVDVIKIDRSFVMSIGEDKSSETLVETILVMAKKLNLKVVAEGIETQQQLNYLVSHGCDYGQGYYLARPLPKQDFIEFVLGESNPPVNL